MQTASWLVSRELTEAAGPWDIRLLGDDDGEYFSRVVRASQGIRFAPQSKTFYRRVGSNRLSHVGLSHKKLDAHFLSMQLQIRNIRSLEESERVRSACLTFLQRYMIYFYPERSEIIKQLEQLCHRSRRSLRGSPIIVEIRMDPKAVWVADREANSISVQRMQVISPEFLGRRTLSSENLTDPLTKLSHEQRLFMALILSLSISLQPQPGCS